MKSDKFSAHFLLDWQERKAGRGSTFPTKTILAFVSKATD
jgi:hypothetical protein